MDQQLDQYQEGLKRLWQRLKAGYLPNVAYKQKRVISFMVVIIVFDIMTVFVQGVRLIKSNLTAPLFIKEDIIYDLFALISPVLTLVGVYLLSRVKRTGWILVASFIMSALLGVALACRDLLIRRDDILDGLILVHNDFIWRDIVLVGLMGLLFLGFLLSKPIQNIYQVKGKHALVAFGITFFLAAGSVLLVTYLYNDY